MLNGRIPVPSNVTRLSRAIKAVSQDGVPQIVNYQLGVGSQGGPVTRFVSGTCFVSTPDYDLISSSSNQKSIVFP